MVVREVSQLDDGGATKGIPISGFGRVLQFRFARAGIVR